MPDELLEIAERPGRLDVFLADCTDLSRNRLQTLIRDGFVLVNGAAATKSGALLRAGDAVRLTVPGYGRAPLRMAFLGRARPSDPGR